MADELVFPLKCAIQTYAWGKVGKNSEVAKLSKGDDSNFEIQDDTPYAELWMGTHPNGPSMIKGTELSLEKWIKQHPDKLGSKVQQHFGGSLPFLLKVLSVNKSLSIQAHPHKCHAERLHADHPDIYKDPNHKPEMAIALTPFHAMCGFRHITEVAKYLNDIEEFREVVGGHDLVKLTACCGSLDGPTQCEAMRDCFSAMMKRDKKVVEKALTKLVNRVQHLEGEEKDTFNSDILLKLHAEFPGDVGCFSIYFLNLVTLQPGEAMFLEANLPHAYLSGDCIECMACSDNVVRAGLTPKYIDVHTLCEMLDYAGRSAESTKFPGVTDSNTSVNVTVFKPDINDFAVLKLQVPDNLTDFKLIPVDSASIVIIIAGEAEAHSRTLQNPIDLVRGSVIFISCNEEVHVNVKSKGMLLFRAYAGL